MTALVLDGKAVATALENDLRTRVQALRDRAAGAVPILATILVGDDPASATYVRMKASACKRVGMESLRVELPQSTTTLQLLSAIDRLNADSRVHGILLQHPVPGQINERECFDRIAIEKDVDGVSTQGFGRMAMGEPAYGSATPAGIMRLLAHYRIDLSGKHAVVVGRSPILGKPVAMMLLNANATVTICHSRTQQLPKLIGQADVLVGALGKPHFIQGSWIKDEAIVVDAGYHPGAIGDIDMKGALERCRAYTPVPGGVGPMTIAMLIAQTVEAAEKWQLQR